MSRSIIIAAIITATATIIAAYLLMSQPVPMTPTPPPSPPGPSSIATSISGMVVNKDDDQGLANVAIIDTYSRRTLATTGPDGTFEADCSYFEEEDFPIRIELARGNWRGATHQTNEYLQYGQTRRNVYIYVSDQMMQDIGEYIHK